MKTIGERILYARGLHSVSQETLSRRIGVTRAAVSQWEKGQHPPKRSRIARLTAVFECGPDWITDGAGEPPQPPQPRPAGLAAARVLRDPHFTAIVHPDPAMNEQIAAWVLRERSLEWLSQTYPVVKRRRRRRVKRTSP